VGGLSLGAGIATRFALRCPGRVRSLLVTNSSSASGLPLSVENLVMRARSLEITLGEGMDAMAEYAMTANPNLAERLKLDPGAKAEFYEEYRRLTPIGYANSLRALLAMDHITDELGQLGRRGIPVFLVGGDRDPSLGPMRVMRRRIRGAKLVVLSPASHFANLRSARGLEPRRPRLPRPRGRRPRSGPWPMTDPRGRGRGGQSWIQDSAGGIRGRRARGGVWGPVAAPPALGATRRSASISARR
jgi:hypothetical protein